MDFLLDPFIVQLPQPFESIIQLNEYFFSLSEWSAMLTCDHDEHRFWFSEPAIQALWETDRFPRFSKLREMYEQCDDESILFDIAIVSRACEYILNTPPFIDDVIIKEYPEVCELLPDDELTKMIPEQISDRLQAEVADALAQTFIRLAYTQQQPNNKIFLNILFSSRSLDTSEDQVEINSRCLRIDTNQMLDIDGFWILACNLPVFDEMSQIEEKWEDIEWMIKWTYEDLMKRRVLDANQHKLNINSNLIIGTNFIPSIKQNHFDNINHLKSIFSTVVKILVFLWPREIETHENHYLQRDYKQIERKRDGALAWRAYVTKSRPNIRLHYWVLGEKIELSVVVPHQLYTIK